MRWAGRLLAIGLALLIVALAWASCHPTQRPAWQCLGCFFVGCEIYCSTPPEVVVKQRGTPTP